MPERLLSHRTMADAFVGTWKLVDSKNFDDYMKSLGERTTDAGSGVRWARKAVWALSSSWRALCASGQLLASPGREYWSNSTPSHLIQASWEGVDRIQAWRASKLEGKAWRQLWLQRSGLGGFLGSDVGDVDVRGE